MDWCPVRGVWVDAVRGPEPPAGVPPNRKDAVLEVGEGEDDDEDNDDEVPEMEVEAEESAPGTARGNAREVIDVDKEEDGDDEEGKEEDGDDDEDEDGDDDEEGENPPPALYPKPRGRVPKSKASGLEMAWCGRTGAWMEPRAGHAVDTPSADAEEEEAEAAADEVEEVSDGSSLHTYDGPASTESDDESQPPPPPPPPPPPAAGRVYLCRLCGVPKRGHKCAPAGAAEPAGQEEERSRPPPRLKASFLAGYHSEGKLLKGMSLY